MRPFLLLCVCLIALSAIATGQQAKDQVFSKRAKQALNIYDSEIRKINESSGRQAEKVRQELAYNLKNARIQAEKAKDTADVAAIAALETSLDFAVPVMAPSRAFWEHPKGYFQHLSGPDWVEKTPKGEVVLYEEAARTHEYIEIAQAGEKNPTLIRLFKDTAGFKKPDQKAFTGLYKGQWALPAILR